MCGNPRRCQAENPLIVLFRFPEPALYAALHGFLGSWLGLTLLFCWTYALFYHLCNGIRHLCWDAGYGFELSTIYASGWTMVGASTMLTLAAWIIGFNMHG